MMQVDHIEIAKLELNRGDVLVVRLPPDWSDEQQEVAHDAVKTAMRQADANVPIIIATTAIEFAVIRQTQAEALRRDAEIRRHHAIHGVGAAALGADAK